MLPWLLLACVYLLGMVPTTMTLNPSQAAWWRWLVVGAWPLSILVFVLLSLFDVIVLGWKTLQRIRRGPRPVSKPLPWRPPVHRGRRR